jgi:hypothetical protein
VPSCVSRAAHRHDLLCRRPRSKVGLGTRAALDEHTHRDTGMTADFTAGFPQPPLPA